MSATKLLLVDTNLRRRLQEFSADSLSGVTDMAHWIRIVIGHMGRVLRWLPVCAAIWISSPAIAEQIGEVAYIAGTLSVQKTDGKIRVLSRKSEVQVGDLLSTEKDSFAQINFADKSQATLRPNTRLRIENFKFVESKPKSDNLVFALLKGGLRTVTGLIGKRGDEDSYQLKTTAATIGIRGSSGDTLVCVEGGESDGGPCDKLEPGTYHSTYFGAYILSNEKGSKRVDAGQYAYARNAETEPVILKSDPGMGLDSVPFGLGVRGSAAGGGAGQNQCLVR